MIRIQRYSTFDRGSMESSYEVQRGHLTKIGAYIVDEVLFEAKTKKECIEFLKSISEK